MPGPFWVVVDLVYNLMRLGVAAVAQDETELMREALLMAFEARAAGDHPYGAVIVTPAGTVIDRNRVVSTSDPTAHSEVTAIRQAASQWGLESLRGSLMVTSFEPCPMCLGAILEAGVGKLVIGLRRTVGSGPLGDYTVEGLLLMLGRSGDLTVAQGPLAEQVAGFYESIG